MGLRLAMIAALASIAACDPWFAMSGTVVDAAGRPVEGAEVSLNCDGMVPKTASTDANGHFHYGSVGEFGDECVVSVRSGQRPPLKYPIMKVCTRLSGSKCREVTLNARLP